MVTSPFFFFFFLVVCALRLSSCFFEYTSRAGLFVLRSPFSFFSFAFAHVSLSIVNFPALFYGSLFLFPFIVCRSVCMCRANAYHDVMPVSF